jgi:hypothetical protein
MDCDLPAAEDCACDALSDLDGVGGEPCDFGQRRKKKKQPKQD